MSHPCPVCAAKDLNRIAELCVKAKENIGYSSYDDIVTEINNTVIRMRYSINLDEKHTRGVDRNGHLMVSLRYKCTHCDFDKFMRFKACELTTNDIIEQEQIEAQSQPLALGCSDSVNV
jgi:hypothetical protein